MDDIGMSTPPATKSVPTHLAGPVPYAAAFFLCGWLLASFIGAIHQTPTDPPREHVEWGLLGASVGLLLCLLFAHPTRILGFVPAGSLIWVIIVPIEGGPTPWCRTLACLGGLATACILIPLALTAWRRLGGTGHYKPKLTVPDMVATVALLGALSLCMVLYYVLNITPQSHFWLWWGLHLLGFLASLVILRRPAFEWLAATLMLPMYRIRVLGQGLAQVPWEGPVLVVANHAAWMDPFWIGKVFPRPHTPMMTSQFYDLPGVSFVMKRVLGVIRVPYQLSRRETPEINEAIARLDKGEAVLIFPEGGLRRKEEQILKLFGQGVWRILKERPETPVVCCWIDGNWGSFFSARHGEPCKNKKFDWFRKITLVFDVPKPVPPEILATQQATRRYLMDQVLELRKQLPDYKPEEKPLIPAETAAVEGG